MNAEAATLAKPPLPSGSDGTSIGEVIVGVDSTYPAGEALGWAARLAKASGAGLTAVHAWRPGLGELDAGYERAITRRKRLLGGWCDTARDAGVEPRLVVGAGELIEVLATTAKSGEPGVRRLVVLGRAAPRSGFDHDDDQQCDRIARKLRVPLAIAPSPGAGRALRRVVVGLSGSTSSDAALSWLAWAAGPLGLDIHAVTAFEPFVEWAPRSSQSSVWARVRAELEGPWTAPLRQRGLTCSTRVIEGTNVVGTLAGYARRCHADAIVVGLGGKVGHRRRHPASELLEHCHLPVILVPADARKHTDGVNP